MVNIFGKQKNQPKLEDVRLGKSLENATELNPIESFKLLITHKARYPVKMYNGRHAEVLFKTDDKIYWGYPKAGFSTAYVDKLYYCESAVLNKLMEQFDEFYLFKVEGLVSNWFAENIKEPDAKYGTVNKNGELNIADLGNAYRLSLEGTYLFYNEEIVEQKERGRVYAYPKRVPVTQYKYKVYFNNSNEIQDIEVEKELLD